MAKYSDIKGFTVQTVSTDPAASGISAASWASGENMNRGNNIEAQGSGTSGSAIIAVGGQIAPSTTANNAEKYDGTNWTEVNDLNAARNNAAASSNSPYDSSLYFGGTPPGTGVTNTESWNGSSWTEVSELNLARGSNAGAGTSNTAALCFTGESPEGGAGGPHTDSNELWDGSSWSEEADLSQGRREAGGTGTSTAALCIGGSEDPPANINKVEQWNGSSWTEISEINTARNENASSGTVTSALTFGGRTPSKTANTEHWNGTSWTEVNNLSTARSDSYTGGGTAGSTIMSGGETSTAFTNITEEFTAPTDFGQQVQGQLFFNSTVNAFKETALDVPAGAWAGGGALNTARSSAMGAGTQGAGIVTGGYTPPTTANTEQYDGSSWTEVGDLNSASVSGGMAHNSPYADTIKFGGSPDTDKSESWNNSSWTEQGNLNTGRIGGSGYGDSSTSAGYAGGDPVSSNINENWDGSSWTEVNNLNSARRYGVGTGTKTAALVIAGDTDVPGFPGGRYTARVESWDGTSFSEGTDLNTGGAYRGAAGTQTLAIAFGGGAPSPYVAITEAWNGSTWTEVADLSTARRAWASGIGQSATLGMAAGGEGPSAVQSVTEEFTANLANKTITAS